MHNLAELSMEFIDVLRNSKGKIKLSKSQDDLGKLGYALVRIESQHQLVINIIHIFLNYLVRIGSFPRVKGALVVIARIRSSGVPI